MASLPADRAERALGAQATFCICFPGSAREAGVRARILRAGFASLQMVPAVRGTLLSDAELKAYLTPRAFRTLKQRGARVSGEDVETPGSVGCALSHAACWRRLVEGPAHWQRATIFEDDATFAHDGDGRFLQTLHASVQALETQVDARWELLSFGHFSTRQNERATGSPLVHHCVGAFYGACAYTVTRAGAEKLLQRFFPICVQLDGYLGLAAQPHYPERLRAYFTRDKLVRQQSLLNTQIHGSWAHENPKLLFPEGRAQQALLLLFLLVGAMLVYYWGVRRGRRRARAIAYAQ